MSGRSKGTYEYKSCEKIRKYKKIRFENSKKNNFLFLMLSSKNVIFGVFDVFLSCFALTGAKFDCVVIINVWVFPRLLEQLGVELRNGQRSVEVTNCELRQGPLSMSPSSQKTDWRLHRVQALLPRYVLDSAGERRIFPRTILLCNLYCGKPRYIFYCFFEIFL